MTTKVLTKDVLKGISDRTGLSISTCRELLNKGWTFTDEMRLPIRWELFLDPKFVHIPEEKC